MERNYTCIKLLFTTDCMTQCELDRFSIDATEWIKNVRCKAYFDQIINKQKERI